MSKRSKSSISSHSCVHLLLHEESVDGLLLPDELDNQSVQVDEQGPTKTTGNTAERQRHTTD